MGITLSSVTLDVISSARRPSQPGKQWNGATKVTSGFIGLAFTFFEILGGKASQFHDNPLLVYQLHLKQYIT